MTPNLKELFTQSVDFSNIEQHQCTGWTIAGIVASQCGMQLVIPSDGIGMSGTSVFLPSAKCTGDVLEAYGIFISNENSDERLCSLCTYSKRNRII